MGRPILRLATRLDRRTRLTSWAIAFAIMVLVGALLLVGGLANGVDSVTSRFESGPHLYASGPNLVSSSIDASALTGIPIPFETLRVHLASLEVNNHTFSAVVGALELRSNGSVVVPFPSTSNAIALDAGLASEVAATTGRPANGTGNLTIFGTSHPGLPLAPTPSGRPAVLPDTWAWVRPDLLIGLNPTEGGPIQALLTDVPLDAGLLARLGLTPIDPVGAVAFAHATVADANGPLLFLSVLVGIVIALLVYSTMSLELSERASELQILRSLGTPTRTVAALFGGQAIVLSVLGAALGCALSVVAAHAIIAFASLAGLPNLIILPSPFPAILVGFGVALGAGIVASLPPLTRATRSLVTRPEARPS